MCEVCSMLKTKTPELMSMMQRSCEVVIDKCERISHLFLVFLLLTLIKLIQAQKLQNKTQFSIAVLSKFVSTSPIFRAHNIT